MQSVVEAGLYTVTLHRDWRIRKIKLNCARQMDFTHTVWSPDGRHAVVDSGAPPAMLIDRISLECVPLNVPYGRRFHLVGWSLDSTRFIYALTSPNGYLGNLTGFFEYEVDNGQVRVIASPAAAAAYVGGGLIAALGNRRLNARLIASSPDLILSAELALVDTRQSNITIAPLGFDTPAAALLNGGMVYSQLSEELAVQLFFPNPAGGVPLIVAFFPQTKKVRPIVTAKPGTILSMSWSPIGDLLAVLDVSANPPLITVLSPPLSGTQESGSQPAQ